MALGFRSLLPRGAHPGRPPPLSPRGLRFVSLFGLKIRPGPSSCEELTEVSCTWGPAGSVAGSGALRVSSQGSFRTAALRHEGVQSPPGERWARGAPSPPWLPRVLDPSPSKAKSEGTHKIF
ncbi:hypothetical protein mRhiFer1_008403 [Rhinolophus ferrumequinum]|uniref:Uncharacterized protein n=1 Tax=Rhinolophus ferrumequinum TaxID=59479 RepID=A0A7J7VEH5_RHIFE|nr:hypothetical protein mRhiFer1_008403 [Rhinolophus ferrumequinum]